MFTYSKQYGVNFFTAKALRRDFLCYSKNFFTFATTQPIAMQLNICNTPSESRVAVDTHTHTHTHV